MKKLSSRIGGTLGAALVLTATWSLAGQDSAPHATVDERGGHSVGEHAMPNATQQGAVVDPYSTTKPGITDPTDASRRSDAAGDTAVNSIENAAPASATAMDAVNAAFPSAQPLIRATDLIGKPLEDAQGQGRGSVQDIVLRDDQQGVEYVVLALTDGPDKYYQAALTDIRIAPDGKAVVTDLSAERLSALQSFNRSALADKGQHNLSGLLGMDLQNSTGATICKIRDVLVDTSTGNLGEAMVGLGGWLGFGEKYASLEWSQISFSGQENFAKTDVAEAQLRDRAYTKEEYWQRLGFSGESDSETDLINANEEPVDTGVMTEDERKGDFPRSSTESETTPAAVPERQAY